MTGPGEAGGGQAAIERLIAQVAGALTTNALYPPAHPAVRQALTAPVRAPLPG